MSNNYNCACSALMLLVRWQEGHPACKKTELWDAGVVVCLEQGADWHMAQLMPLPLPLTVSCLSKIQRLVLAFWYWLTRVVPEKGSLNGCAHVCVYFHLVGVHTINLMNQKYSL